MGAELFGRLGLEEQSQAKHRVSSVWLQLVHVEQITNAFRRVQAEREIGTTVERTESKQRSLGCWKAKQSDQVVSTRRYGWLSKIVVKYWQ